MKTFFYSLLPIALLLAFIGCSDNNSGEGGGNNSDVKVPTSGKSVDKLLENAVEELKKENWDEAVAYYNAAYEKDSDNPKTIIYSVLANLAKISTDPKVVTLMKEHFGFTTYPNKLNALLSDKWMKEYPSYILYGYYDESSRKYVYWEEARRGYVPKDGYYYYSYSNGKYTYTLVSDKPKYEYEKLPVIKTPSWVQGKGSMYDEALLSGNVMTADNWAISLLANALDKNSNGFNNFLDDVIDGVFGTSFNLAVERLKKLENKSKNSITLDPYFIKELDLEDIFDKDDQVGWAEVNAVLSAMLLVKSSLEWVQSYDLSIDLNWLKYSWKDDENDIRSHFNDVDASKLPFNNNFFNVRPGKMKNAKADYVKAVQGFQKSYAAIVNSDIYPTEVKDYYRAINGGFDELIKAISNGGKFYIPKEITKNSTWPTTKNGNVVATVDLGKFFEEGYFSLPNIFETDGKKPVFYLTYDNDDYDYGYDCHWEEVEYWDDYLEEWDYYYDLVCEDPPEPEPKKEPVQLKKDNYAALISDGGYLSLAVKIAQFKAIADIDDLDYSEVEYIPIGLDGKNAKIVFEKYYK